MQLKISHTTEYHYDQPVQMALQRLRLTPRTCTGQTVTQWKTFVEGATVEAAYDDQFGNHTQLLSAEPDTRLTRIRAEGEVETTDVTGVFGPHVGFAPLWLFKRDTDLTKPGKSTREIVRSISEDDDLAKMHALMAAIHEAVAFEPGTTHTTTTAEEALEAGRGVCQDHAHVFIAASRLMGHSSRYVSGYIKLHDTDNQAASHAWAESYIDGLGWVGFDAANDMSPDEQYVRIATGLDYRDAAPVSGIRMGISSETLAVSISVEQ